MRVFTRAWQSLCAGIGPGGLRGADQWPQCRDPGANCPGNTSQDWPAAPHGGGRSVHRCRADDVARRLPGGGHSGDQQRRPGAGSSGGLGSRGLAGCHRGQHALGHSADSGAGWRNAHPRFWPHRQYHLGDGQVATLALGFVHGGACGADRFLQSPVSRGGAGQCDH
ncbi:hypothetical protein D3C87_1555540 [compost metagenome]